jgi:hypothetical protein
MAAPATFSRIKSTHQSKTTIAAELRLMPATIETPRRFARLQTLDRITQTILNLEQEIQPRARKSQAMSSKFFLHDSKIAPHLAG